MILNDSHTSDVIWSRLASWPLDGNTGDLRSFASSIATEIAAIGGIIHRAQVRKLKSNADIIGAVGSSAYECVLLYFVYDQHKREIDGERAMACLSHLVENKSTNSTVWSAWGFLNFLQWSASGDDTRSPQFRRALVAARKSVQLDPNSAEAHEKLGSILMADGDMVPAIKAFERAAEINPFKPDLPVLVGWNKALRGQWDEGEYLIRKGIESSPNPAGWMYIPLSLVAFRRGQYEEALENAETIIAKGDDRGLILALAAQVALENEAAVADLRERFKTYREGNINDPMLEIRTVFNKPDILERYNSVVEHALSF